MKVHSVIAILLLFPLSIFAQEQDSLKVSEDTIMLSSVRTVNVDSLQQEVNRLNKLVERYRENENSLNGKIYDLQQTILEKNEEIERLDRHLIFADSIVARISNDCLRKKYDQVRVTQAIANFEQMYSPELKSKFARLKFLLIEYGNFTDELTAVLTEAQNDKELGNPFTGQNRALSYIDKIKGTRYYQNIYSNDWTIPYLNEFIDKCFEALQSFNPKESKELHLLDLMY